MKPVINVVTRFSRKENIEKCLNHLYEQTYDNIHHVITYETDELRKYLETEINHGITTMVRVPNLNMIPKLCRYYNHHDRVLNFIEPDLDFMNTKISINSEDPSPHEKIPVEPKKYWNKGWWCMDLNHSLRSREHHFPYNQYVKIAEKAYKKGWVTILDDDDAWTSKNTLSTIADQINSHSKDTVHIWKFNTVRDGIKPHSNWWNYMKADHPIIRGNITSGCYIHHTDYCEYTQWNEWSNADYRTLKALEQIGLKKNFIDEVLYSHDRDIWIENR